MKALIVAIISMCSKLESLSKLHFDSNQTKVLRCSGALFVTKVALVVSGAASPHSSGLVLTANQILYELSFASDL